MGQLSALRYLRLQENAFSGTVPDSMFDLSALEILYLQYQYNNEWTCTRSSGEIINVYYSKGDATNGLNLGLLGKILDDELANLTSLRDIRVGNNQFSGVSEIRIHRFKFFLHIELKSRCVSSSRRFRRKFHTWKTWVSVWHLRVILYYFELKRMVRSNRKIFVRFSIAKKYFTPRKTRSVVVFLTKSQRWTTFVKFGFMTTTLPERYLRMWAT